MIDLDTIHQENISSCNNILAAFEYSRELAAIHEIDSICSADLNFRFRFFVNRE